MLSVALTGGIGSGKSTVATLFAELGAPIIDADVLSRELVVPGSPALAEIAALFGPDILDSTGQLDRQQLRTLIFADPQRRGQLENILHSKILQRMQQWLNEQHDRTDPPPYGLLCIPLLLETAQNRLFDRVLVVDLPTELQIERAMQRDGASESGIRAIMATQVDRSRRLQAADDIIHNDGDIEALRVQVHDLDRQYRQMSA